MKFRMLAWIWLVAVTGLSLMSTENLKPWNWLSMLSLDKWLHALTYAIMYALFALSRRHNGETSRYHWDVFVFCALYGLFLECLQNYFGRHFDVLDIIANIIGLLVGLWFTNKFAK